MNILICVIVSSMVSAFVTEIRCRIHLDAIDKMVEETIQKVKDTFDKCVCEISERFER